VTKAEKKKGRGKQRKKGGKRGKGKRRGKETRPLIEISGYATDDETKLTTPRVLRCRCGCVRHVAVYYSVKYHFYFLLHVRKKHKLIISGLEAL